MKRDRKRKLALKHDFSNLQIEKYRKYYVDKLYSKQVRPISGNDSNNELISHNMSPIKRDSCTKVFTLYNFKVSLVIILVLILCPFLLYLISLLILIIGL